MAHFDGEKIVVRVVYDGALWAGKSASVHSLSAAFGIAVETSARDVDSMECEAGQFAGHPVYCEVVTAPGGQLAADRRREMIMQADAVIFVADTTEIGIVGSAALLGALRARLARASSKTPVIVQANKRDMADAVVIEEVRERLGAATDDLVETVAIDDGGESVGRAFKRAVEAVIDGLDESIIATDRIELEATVSPPAAKEEERESMDRDEFEVEPPAAEQPVEQQPAPPEVEPDDEPMIEATIGPPRLPPSAVRPRERKPTQSLPQLDSDDDDDDGDIEISFSPSVLRD